VAHIVIVDNGSQPPAAELVEREPALRAARAAGRLEVIALPDNRGVAQGLNVGVARARERGAQFVLLLDDDSVPDAGMVATLLAGFDRGRTESGKAPVAAVGPRVSDVRDPRDYPFIRLGWIHNRHLRCGDSSDGVVACDFLISSGSLIALESLAAIGEFDETLFIDSVDLEWCCRARARGFALYGVCGARLDHRLGDHRRRIMKGVELVVHPPERLYYMTRNRLLLYARPYMPLKWKLKDLLRVMAKFAATMLLIAPRFEYARMTLRAVRDAAARRGGKLERDEA
jgi:rhamnosyltransferase